MPKAKLTTRERTTSNVSTDNLNKGSELSFAEADSNFINLRDASFGIADDTSTVLQVTDDKTITIAGGTNVTTALSGDTLTINSTATVASFGDLTAIGSTISAPSNADLTLEPGGTGDVIVNSTNFNESTASISGVNHQIRTIDGGSTSEPAILKLKASGQGTLNQGDENHIQFESYNGHYTFHKGDKTQPMLTTESGSAIEKIQIATLEGFHQDGIIVDGSASGKIEFHQPTDFNSHAITNLGAITGTVSVANTTTNDSLLITTTEDSSTAAPVITLKRNSSNPADADYLGQLKFKGENDADQEVVYAKITAKISDASDTTEDGLIEFALRKAGSNNIGARLTSTQLKLINGTGLEVAGLTYPTSDGTNGQILKTNGSGVLSFGDGTQSNITTSDFAAATLITEGDYAATQTENDTTILTSGATADAIERQKLKAETSNTGPGNTTMSVDRDTSGIIRETLTASITVSTIQNFEAGQSMIFIFTQDGTGSRTVTFTDTIKWLGGSSTLSTGPNKVDKVTLINDGAKILGELNKDYS